MKEFIASENPYTLQFSFIPPQYISRQRLTDEIIGDLTKKVPAFRCHFLTGIRGCGKTVMMADISNKMKTETDWIVVDIENPENDLLDSLSRGLYRIPLLKSLFINAKLDLSLLGIGVSVEKAELVASNASDAVDMMLKILQKAGKKLLVAIDEVTYCKEIAAFSHSLSSYARNGYEIYVLMTGLKENIKEIKNDKSLTFLYRAKEHILEPLNMTAVVYDYKTVFGITQEQSEHMAWNTKGYAFAFQILGYLYWEACCSRKYEDINVDRLLADYDQYLSEFAYDKIWSEMSPKEREILWSMAENHLSDVKAIREKLEMNSSKFSVYRSRLIDKGVLNGQEYGTLKFTLPRFSEYAAIRGRMDL